MFKICDVFDNRNSMWMFTFLNLLSLTESIDVICTHQVCFYIYASSLSSLQMQTIVFSILINRDFEVKLRNTLNKMINVSFDIRKLFNHFVTIHESLSFRWKNEWFLSKSAKSLNLRFWFIEKSNMWIDQHNIFDEIFELLWSCHKWFRLNMIDNEFDVLHFARVCKKRIVLSKITNVHENQSVRLFSKLSSLRKFMFFRSWILQTFSINFVWRHVILNERFWRSDDENNWNQSDVSFWRNFNQQNVFFKRMIMFDDVAMSIIEFNTRDTSFSMTIIIDETIFDDTIFLNEFSRSAEIVLH